MTKFTVNGKNVTSDVPGDTPLLWFIREELGLTGTKFGCGIAQCGACTVMVNGVATRSCVTPIVIVDGQNITTIEGLAPGGQLSHVQKAWDELDVVQCGYCQSGQIMAATALLNANPRPSDAEIDAEMTNLCRCGTYPHIKAAIKRAAGLA
jgi:isoquinoline 1-oxidoreductase subunit alpha